jgi:hypothetical protein
MTERSSNQLKTALTIAAIAVPFFVGWGALETRIGDIKAVQLRVLAEKADKPTVDVQYAAILRELQAIGRRLDRLESRR